MANIGTKFLKYTHWYISFEKAEMELGTSQDECRGRRRGVITQELQRRHDPKDLEHQVGTFRPSHFQNGRRGVLIRDIRQGRMWGGGKHKRAGHIYELRREHGQGC